LHYQLIALKTKKTETICQREFNKHYEPSEDAERKDIFKEKLKFIYEHNAAHARGETTFTVGINHFADKRPGEFSGGLIRPSRQ